MVNKEIREEDFVPQFLFFFVGDFMDKVIQDKQVMFRWAMSTAQVSLKELEKLETPMQRFEFIQLKITQRLKSFSIKFVDYYPFDSHWIMD